MRRTAAAVLAGLSLTCAACSMPIEADEDATPDLTLTIPDVRSARVALRAAIADLTGVESVSSAYSQPTRVLELWVHYEPVAVRWPINQRIELAVRAAVEPYAAYRSGTVLIEIGDTAEPTDRR